MSDKKILQAIALLHEANGDPIDLNCPFCRDDGFDKIGLKIHFERGYCDEYQRTPIEDPKQEGQ